MKFFILISLFATLAFSWAVDIQIYNSRSGFAGFYRSFRMVIESNMGGHTFLGCIAYDQNNPKCGSDQKVWSTQGGYHIKYLNCNGLKCNIEVETEGVKFNLEAACEKEFDMNLELPTFGQTYERCEFKRHYQLYLDGSIEYEN